MKQILLIDDDQDIHVLVEKICKNENYLMTSCFTLSEARSEITSRKFDLVILDEELPDGLGSSLYNELNSESAVIVLTKRKDFGIKKLAFSLGVDDFVEKPFDIKELMLRMKVRIKNKKHYIKNDTFGPLVIDSARQDVYVESPNKKEYLFLTPIEFRIFSFMVKKPEFIFSRETILNEVWGEGQMVEPRTIDQHVSKLRKKIEIYDVNIRSVHRRGYQIRNNFIN